MIMSMECESIFFKKNKLDPSVVSQLKESDLCDMESNTTSVLFNTTGVQNGKERRAEYKIFLITAMM